MTVRIDINGYAHIDCNVLRALCEGEHKGEVQVLALNDLGTNAQCDPALVLAGA